MNVPEALRTALDRLGLDRLSDRERRLLGLGAAALAALVVMILVRGVHGRLSALETEIRSGSARVARVQAELAEYRRLEAEIAELERRAQGPTASLAQRVEQLAAEAGLAEQVKRTSDRATPPIAEGMSQSGVEVVIEGAALPAVVKLLAAIEGDTRSLLSLARTRLEARGEAGKRTIDANLHVLRFEKAG